MEQVSAERTVNPERHLSAADLNVSVKSIREPASESDGRRILVNRLWPRGVTREQAALSEWRPDWAPSWPIRQLLHLAPATWPEFRQRYRAELLTRGKMAEIRILGELAKRARITLVYTGRNPDYNVATALLSFLEES